MTSEVEGSSRVVTGGTGVKGLKVSETEKIWQILFVCVSKFRLSRKRIWG